jgi:hypothetical protein
VRVEGVCCVFTPGWVGRRRGRRVAGAWLLGWALGVGGVGAAGAGKTRPGPLCRLGYVPSGMPPAGAGCSYCRRWRRRQLAGRPAVVALRASCGRPPRRVAHLLGSRVSEGAEVVASTCGCHGGGGRPRGRRRRPLVRRAGRLCNAPLDLLGESLGVAVALVAGEHDLGRDSSHVVPVEGPKCLVPWSTICVIKLTTCYLSTSVARRVRPRDPRSETRPLHASPNRPRHAGLATIPGGGQQRAKHRTWPPRSNECR